MRTRDAGVVSLNPACATKAQLVTKARGNYLIKSNSLEKLRALSLVSARLKVKYVTPF